MRIFSHPAPSPPGWRHPCVADRTWLRRRIRVQSSFTWPLAHDRIQVQVRCDFSHLRWEDHV